MDLQSAVSQDGVRVDAPQSQPSPQSKDTLLTVVHSQPNSMTTSSQQIASPTQVSLQLQLRQEALYTTYCERLFWSMSPSTTEGFNQLLSHLTEAKGVLLVSKDTGSLIIRVACPSLEILENLWSDYRSGQLEKQAESCLVTEDFLREFNLKEVKLRVEMSEEEYETCHHELMKQGEKFRTKTKNRTPVYFLQIAV